MSDMKTEQKVSVDGKIFEDETEYTIYLPINKQKYWEYILTAELLHLKMALTRRWIENLKEDFL